MGRLSFEEALGLYMTCLIHVVIYKNSYAFYLVTI